MRISDWSSDVCSADLERGKRMGVHAVSPLRNIQLNPVALPLRHAITDATAMKLWSIEGNSQKLDGGAMFGNAPRAMWARWLAPDEHNRIPLACLALLASPLAGTTVLFETGIGACFEPKLRERYGVQADRHVLLD